ncbi:DUF6506 family protein [Elioraea sp.]|uniref:DUF6506 family protein n=1 Tax=Elioraea sp. TaxID=2185103 RepID=UPI003F7253FB
MNIWATIILWDEADPGTDRLVRETKHERLTIVFAPSFESAASVAAELAEQGTGLIELCGGFGINGSAAVLKAVDGRAAVGSVSFGIDSLTQAAAYKTKFEATLAGD